MKPRQRHVLFAVLLATAALAQEPTWTRVATIDVHRPDGGGFVEDASCYHYSAAEIPIAKLPADAAERDVLFGARLPFRFAGLWPQARYELRVRLLSDSDARVVHCTSGSTVVADALRLPNGEVTAQRFPLLASAGNLASFTLRAAAGPNVPVCGLEVWSTDPTPLLTPPPLREAVRGIQVAWPQLTPRPFTVTGLQSPMLPLDGTWRFRCEPLPPGAHVDADAIAAWQPIEVPGEWAMQGFAATADRATTYARTFELPADWRGKQLRLRFDSAHSIAVVWLNEVQVGHHEGGFVPFECDVTAAAREGTNLLRVQVTSASLADTLASASQYAAHPLGGITRKVQLWALPQLCATSAALDADFDPATRTGIVRAELELSGRGAVRLRVRDGDRIVAEHTTPVAAGRITAQFALPGAQPWDAEHPQLYDLFVAVLDGRDVTETLWRRVGFRRIEVRGNRLFVNDRPIKLKGACRHELHPLRGRSLTPSLCEQDARLFVEANCNYVRTSHYPPSEEFLDACDRLGLFVECEAALCWVQHGANTAWGELDSLDPALLPYLVGANQDNVAANRHHPSIIIWSLANESRWSPLFAEVNARIKRADPTRPTSFHDQCWGDYNNARSEADIAVYHYPDENGPAKCDQESRPVLFGEYCHVECYNRRELVTDPGVRDDWGRGFARMYELMYAHDGCLGGAIWAAFDDVFCLPDGRTTGYGPWGCIADGWRRDKPESFHVKNAYAPIRVDVAAVRCESGRLRVPIENRFDFTDLSEVTIEWQKWRTGGRPNLAHLALPPHARGELDLPDPGSGVLLTFTDPRGVVCLQVNLDLAPAPAPATATGAAAARWRLDGERVLAGEVGGKAVVVDGPDFMLLPLQNDKCEPVDLALADPLNDVADAKVATGHFELHADGARLTLRYDFTATAAINPRQWGAVLWLAPDCDQLAWRRDTQWTIYPADHIGRPFGAATPRLLAAPQPYPRTDPQQPWSEDATLLGGHDFTATRTNLRELCLCADDGRGLCVRSDGTLAARAFVQGDRIGLLLAGYHTGGGDGFFATHLAAERRPLQAGAHMTGECTIELIDR